MAIELFEHQKEALQKMHNGCILCGGTGSGKSLTAVAYYFFQNGGIYNRGQYFDMIEPEDLYIITTARKRDEKEWEGELVHFLITPDDETKHYNHNVVIDSWNNVKKYKDVKNSFFIFDEQRVVGYGEWTKSFLKITQANKWILLTATPGDTWSDYMPVFIANGFYKNKTDFTSQHCVYSRFTKYPQIERYVGTKKLTWCRNQVLVNMPVRRKTVQKHRDVRCTYDILAYKQLCKERFNYEKMEPIQSASELCYELRKICNSDYSRIEALRTILEGHPKIIVFYNFDYELELIKAENWDDDVTVAEWNGHMHQKVPETDSWIYLVQYSAGAEAWNCTATDTIVFYSQNYSYKVMVQASGRIDRLNTKFTDLWYYHLKSSSSIDGAINRALKSKKRFNESAFAGF